MKTLVVGANGGIGAECLAELTSRGFSCQGLTSVDLDLNHPLRVFELDLSGIDILINCAGHSQGTYRGFLHNTWQNQFSQIMVNYVSNLALLKHFALSRPAGTFVWISTSLLDSDARPFHSIYLSTKSASKIAIDLVRQEANHIRILEVNIGPTQTRFRHRNFEGTKTVEEVNSSYDPENSLQASTVAAKIVDAIESHAESIYIK